MTYWLVLIVWAALLVYSVMCVFLPEVRPYFRGGRWMFGEHRRWGLLTSVGFAMMVWLPTIFYAGIVTGLIPGAYVFGVYLLAVFGALVAIIGGWIEFLP